MSQALQTLRTAVQDGRADALVLAVLEEIHPAGANRPAKKTTPQAQQASEQEK